MTVGVLVNGNARRHQRRPGLAQRYVSQGAVVVQTHSLEELPAGIAQLQAAGVHTVALSGGDGAVHRGLTALSKAWEGRLPRIALLPAGTMNTVARGLGVRGSPSAVLARALNADAAVMDRFPIDAGEGRLGFLVGTGFWAQFLRQYDQRTGPGPLRAAAVLGRGLASTVIQGRFVRELFEPVRARVSLDRKALDGERFTMVAAGAVPTVGLGFSPFSTVAEGVAGMHALAFQSRPVGVAVQLPRLFFGGSPRSPDTGGPVKELAIEAEQPFLWAMDGDVQAPTQRLCLSVGPRLCIVR